MASDVGYRFAPAGVTPEASRSPWKPIKIPRSAIEHEITRLRNMPLAEASRRASEIVHDRARDMGMGLTPGLSVSINVLNPHEEITIDRDNSNRVEFCLSGTGHARLGANDFAPEKWSVWAVPSMTNRQYRNDSDEALVWLSYSNQPVLERLGIYYTDGAVQSPALTLSGATPSGEYTRNNAPDLPIMTDGARLRGYEFLTDIEPVRNVPLHWPWQEIVPHLSREEGDGKRVIMLLYNPATERRNGTTHSFFATFSSVPPGRGLPHPARGHRHSSFATNYHFEGSGISVVDGQRIEWEAGDLLLSAPSWSEHAHGVSETGASILTIQDHPFQIGAEALIWQESFDGPIKTLGSEAGQTGYVAPRTVGE